MKKQKKRSSFTVLSRLGILTLFFMALLPVLGYAQNCGFTIGCNNTDYSNYGFNSSTPGTLEYDNFISSFHATTVRNKEGKLLVWGQTSANNGTGHLTAITEINKTNFPALTTGSVPLKAAMASDGVASSGIYQRVLLASDGLYAWGTEGGIIHSDLTSGTTFAKLSIGLPSGVQPADVKMMFATFHTLAIVTCNGDGWVLTSQYPSMRGDGTTAAGTGNTNLKTWARVKTGTNTNLANIVAIRGNYRTLMALTSTNEVYTWGEQTVLGSENSATQSQRSYATKMTLPNSTPIKMIGVANYSNKSNGATYYVLYTNGNLYSMGNNALNQLGDNGTTNSPSSSNRRWVQPTGVSNIKWISPNEHDPNFPAINVIASVVGSPRIYNWGSNAGSMLGRTNSSQGGTTTTAFDPGQPLDNTPFLTSSDILGVEMGGHTTMIVQKCQEKFGYVGHFTNGSATGSGSSFYSKFVFNTAEVEICGIESGVVNLSLEPNGAAVTIGVPIQLTYAPAGGTFQVTSGNATVTNSGVLTPTGSGEIKITYTVTGGCSPNSVTVTISANRVKINANDDFNAGVIKTWIPGNVKTNDNVPNATYGTSPALVGSPSGSSPTITMNADGTYEFKTDKPGVYTYNVVVCPQGQSTGCPTTKLIITVTDPLLSNSANNKPHADLDLGTTKINTPITLDITANDGPGNTGKTLGTPTITSDPSNGSAEIVGGKLVYTPNTGFTGKDTVTYQVCDTPTPPTGNCATAIAIITVLPNGTNTTSAADDYNSTAQGIAVSGNVKTNDVDIEGNTTTVTAQNTTIPGKGTLVLNTNGTYTFTPEADFVGTVDLPYTICDNATPQACAQATLHIVVYNTTALAVNFGNINVAFKNGQLLIDWSTLKESNNGHFEIEASVDGVTFTKIGEVISKAKDGNSSVVLNYDFTTQANDLAMKLGISFMLIGGLGIGFIFKRRRNKLIAMGIAMALTVIAISCNKGNDVSVVKDGKLFIRIAQVDKNGAKQYSKIVQVVQ